MKFLRLLPFLFLGIGALSPAQLLAQRSKHGAKVVATANNVVNEYTSLTAPAAAGATTITVANSTLNTNGRFTGNLAPGDLIMIIQIQGASLRGTPWTPDPNFGDPRDSTWGEIINYNNCGNWEFAEVYSVPTGTSITLDCPLTNNYTSSGKVVVVRVPRYSSLTINNGGTIICDTWNGTIGGICAIEVENNTVINTGGSINVTGRGFRGGALHSAGSAYGVGDATASPPANGAEKGEGIAGYQADYTPYGGMNCKGAPANGGGGGNAHNNAGGGGANGGDPSLWNGHGNPDITTNAAWISAWNMQYANFATQTSSGGGQGGYSFCAKDGNALSDPLTNLAIWGGDQRRPNGGYGGRPLDYSTGRLFLGGGGGAGDQDNNLAGAGGRGGALIYLMNYGTVSGAGQIIANGNNGANAPGKDAAGGAGAGGTIVVNSVGTISGVTLTANGGKGGDQTIGFGTEAEGPGGGGSGGHIAISNGTPVRTTNGGANGTTDSFALNEFPPNGATRGGAGTNNASVTNFIINAANVTICSGQSATLSATLGGTPPGGTNIVWYDANVAGNVLGNGATYVTPPVASTTTYYVGTCPGIYHQPVVVTTTSSPVVSAGSDVTICSAGSTTLNASGGTAYAWSPATGLSSTVISNPVANPVSTTTYVVTVTTSCGNSNAAVVVSVNSSITASISGNTTICTGSATTLTASGGNNYSWSTGATTSSIAVSPTASTTYSVTVTSGSCSSTTSTTVNVGSAIVASVSGNTTICAGSSATLNASGGTDYLWSNGSTDAAIAVAPTASTTYSVMVTSGNCSSSTSITVNTSPLITAQMSNVAITCGASNGSATASASGGTGALTYSWNPGGQTTSTASGLNTGGNYTVTISDAIGCTITATVNVTSLNAPVVSISGNTSLCTGDATTLTASGGNTYTWSTGSTATSIVITPNASFMYTVISYTGNCSDTDTVIVNVLPPPIANISSNTTICSGQSATLTAIGGGNYSWNNGATSSAITVSPTNISSYSVIVSIGSCSDTASATVNVVSTPTASITSSSSTTICGGDVITLNASGGSTYLWNNGNTTSAITVNPASTTPYSVSAGNGYCTNTTTITVTVLPSPVANILGNNTICQGFVATLTATGGSTYAWSSGETTATINPNAAGNYSVVVTAGSCADTAVSNVTVSQNPTATVSPDITILQGQSTNLTASGGATYAWDNGSNGATITVSPVVTTTYCVTTYNASNCYNTACVTVSIELCSTGTLYLPNAFSPNGDGENDVLQIYYGNAACIQSFTLVIYNRWGEKIYETDDSSFRWNGVYNKGILKETTKGGTEAYAYYMNVEIIDGTKISKKGSISLIR